MYKQDDRFRLCSETAGIVHIEAPDTHLAAAQLSPSPGLCWEVGVLLKDFEQHGVETFSANAVNEVSARGVSVRTRP